MIRKDKNIYYFFKILYLFFCIVIYVVIIEFLLELYLVYNCLKKRSENLKF